MNKKENAQDSNTSLMDALKPFAELAELYDDENRGTTMPKSGPIMHWPRLNKDYVLTVEHLRAAREVLSSHPMPAQAAATEQASIDTPEFWKAAANWVGARGTLYDTAARARLVKFINDHFAAPLATPADAGAGILAGTVPDEIRAIGGLIATQDNRYTDQPMFIVQQRRRITGLDTGYCDNIVWLCSEDGYSEASAEEAAQLEAEYQETGRERSGWVRTGYMDEWEFVTACFTEHGCKDYLKRDGHNLKEPRIFAEGSYRNEEYRTLRNWLLSLARPSTPGAPVTADAGAAAARNGMSRGLRDAERQAADDPRQVRAPVPDRGRGRRLRNRIQRGRRHLLHQGRVAGVHRQLGRVFELLRGRRRRHPLEAAASSAVPGGERKAGRERVMKKVKVSFKVTIDGGRMYGGESVTPAVIERELREALKWQFDLPANRMTVKRLPEETNKEQTQ